MKENYTLHEAIAYFLQTYDKPALGVAYNLGDILLIELNFGEALPLDREPSPRWYRYQEKDSTKNHEPTIFTPEEFDGAKKIIENELKKITSVDPDFPAGSVDGYFV